MATTPPSTTGLATPLRLPCGAVLPNRIAKAAMSEQLARRDGTPSPELSRLYETWGRSGAGLLVTGNVMVSREALTEPGNVILDDARSMEALQEWTAAAQEGGARIWAQLNHPGRLAVAPWGRRPVAPSARRSPAPGYNLRKPRALGACEVPRVVEAFARSAGLAVAGGFDGVQIHAAHGYLLSQFLSPLANGRNDEWGGDPERRMAPLLEVVAAVRRRVGPRVPVGVKLNSSDFRRGGFADHDAREVALTLAEAGVDLLEISGGGYEEPAMTGVAHGQEHRSTEGYFADFAAGLRQATSMPLMLTGGLRTPAYLESLVASHTVDVVGIARPMAFVPDYPRHVLEGRQPALPRPPRRSGYRPLDGYADLARHNVQLRRIAHGERPEQKPGLRTVTRSAGRTGVAVVKQARIPH